MPENEASTIHMVFANNSPLENVTIEENDGMYVQGGGTATGTIISSGGTMVVSEGGKASNTTVGGSLTVMNGGSAAIVTVKDGGQLFVSGRVSSATVSRGGSATVYEDGTAREFIIDGGELNLSSGAYVFPVTGGSKTIVKDGGQLFVFKGARIEGVEIISGGYASINGSMTSAIFGAGTGPDAGHCFGSATVRDGAVVEKATVYDGSVLTVESGGEVKDTTFSIGGKITGNMYKCSTLTFKTGIVDFNISVSEPEDGYFINDLSSFFAPKTETFQCFYTVTADIDQSNGTYKLIQDATGFLDTQEVKIVNSENELDLFGGITIKEGTKTIKGRQYTLNMSSDNELTLTIAGGPDRHADNGWNDWAVSRDNKSLNEDLNTPSLLYSESNQEWEENWFQFDHEDEVSYGGGEDDEVGMTNFVGMNNDKIDPIDYMKVALAEPVLLSFSVSATDAARFTLYQLVGSEGNYNLNELLTVDLPEDPLSDSFYVATDPILLNGDAESAVYYISVASTNPDGQAYYSVKANEETSIAFHYGADDDWTDMATQGAQSATVGSLGVLNATMKGRMIGEGWVGYCDRIDYCLFSLYADATVCFGFDATDDATFTVYELETNDGTFSLKQLLSTSIMSEEGIETKGLELELQAGVQYAYSVESPKANDMELGHAYYKLTLSENSSFAVHNADNGRNDELNDRTLALTVIGRDGNSHFTYLYDNITPLDEILLDELDSVTYQDETDNEFHNFVGTENDIVDEKDYAKIRFEDDAYVSFSVTATAAVTFSLYRVVDGITQLLQTSKAKLNSKTKRYTVTTNQIYLPISAGEDTTIPDNVSYYISVAPTNANSDDQAYYRVTLDEKSKIFQGRNGHYDDGTELEEKGPLGDIGAMKKETIDQTVRAELRAQGEVTLVEDWVGHNDHVDYKLLKFNVGAIANFTVTTTAGGKFYVYQFIEEDDGTYTLKRLRKISLKAGTKEIGEIQFDGGSQYAICMESTVLYADNSYTVSLKEGNLKLYADADDNTNNWLLKDNSTVLNGKIRTFTITNKTTSINVDEAGSVTESPEDEYENYVGPGDTADVVELKMERNTALTLTVDALSKMRFKIIEVTQTAANKYKTKTLLSKTINPQQTNAPVLLNPNPILLLSDAMRGENVHYYAVAEYLAKDGSTGYYNVDIKGSKFAPSGGTDKTDDKPATADFIPSETLTLAPITLTTLDDWIGFGDTSDCRRFNLEHDAVVSFDLSSQAATFFYLYSVKDGNATKIQTTTLLKQNGSYKNTSARIHLKAGSYAFEMKLSSKVAKNFESYFYTVELNTKKSAIFDQIDKINNNDDWKNSSKGVSSESLDKTTVGTLTSARANPYNPIIEDDWVCLGDVKDCKWFTVADDTVNAAFTCKGTGNGTVKFGIYSIVRKTSKTYTTKKIFEKKETADADGKFSISTGALSFMGGNNYVIIVQSTTAKNCGYAKYSVTLNTYNVANKSALEWDDVSEQSTGSLAMPETSDSLAMTDSLSLGNYGADALADVSGIESLNGQSDLLKLGSIA